jgi:hypothetical protein
MAVATRAGEVDDLASFGGTAAGRELVAVRRHGGVGRMQLLSCRRATQFIGGRLRGCLDAVKSDHEHEPFTAH